MVVWPITPEFFLFATDTERVAMRKALHPAKDAALDRNIGKHQIPRDVLLIYLGADKAKWMQTLRHGREREAVLRGRINERTFPGVITRQKKMLFLLVPDCKAEGARQMLDTLFTPALPRRQQHRAVSHHGGLLAGKTQLQPKLYTVVETYIRDQRSHP